MNADEPDDRLLRDQIELIGVDWRDNFIFLKISQVPTSQWIECFQSIDYRYSILDKSPDRFNFQADVASIAIKKDKAQRLVDDFKRFLNLAKDAYAAKVAREAKEREEAAQSRTENCGEGAGCTGLQRDKRPRPYE